VLAATVSVTLPLPVLALPDATAIQAALLTDVHEQLPVVVTLSGPPAPPAAPMVRLAGVTAKAQAVAAS
jgi:hypothetical protein